MSQDLQVKPEEPKQSKALVRVHQVEHTVSLPAGMPATNPDVPRVEMTQEQIDFLIHNMPGKWLPAMKKWWPVIIMVIGFAGKMGATIDHAMTQLPADPPVNAKSLELQKAKAAPDLQQMIDDAVKRSLEKTRSPELRAEPKMLPEPKVEKVDPKEPFEFRKG